MSEHQCAGCQACWGDEPEGEGPTSQELETILAAGLPHPIDERVASALERISASGAVVAENSYDDSASLAGIHTALGRIATALEACKECRGKGYVMTGPSLESTWDCLRCQGTGKWAGA